ncbi:DCC1-like thiol-disulfide oxidoreductase family protein [Methylobacterium sp. A54F]
MTQDPRLSVVYDGECPFCSNYVRLMALRRSVGPVALIDARLGGSLVEDIRQRGYDLDKGMVVRYGQHLYFGADALVLLSQLSEDETRIGRGLARLLRSPARARFLYPLMKLGRRATLLLLGRRLIAQQNHRGSHPR